MVKNYRYTEVGKYVVEDIFMLDNSTCNMTFFAEKVKDGLKQIEVEYWLDDKSWHFVMNYYDDYEGFVDHEEFKGFTEEEKQKCKDIMAEYIDSVMYNKD